MNKYRSLDAWRHAHALACTALRFADAHYSARARPLLDQLRRAAISVEANIVEGYALSTTPYFRRHLRIALGSAAEVECLVRLAAEVGYASAEPARELETLCDRTIGTLRGLLRRLPARKV
ncbi:MAG: four helix bundle protein [Gemmatimonadota bacterium]|jgi:four helix bundle protein